MSIDKFEFMESAWGFSKAPINVDAIQRPTDPFSRAACAREIDLFERKFIAGGIRGRLTYGYLWSVPNPKLPVEGTGTGYGKTSLMRATEADINNDWGDSMLRRLNFKDPPMITAAFTSLDNEDTRGLYALLFSAVERWSDASQCMGPNGSVLHSARTRIVERLGCDDDDEAAIRKEVERARHALPGGGTLPPLREQILAAFCSPDEDALKNELADIPPGTRSRSGLSLFRSRVCLSSGRRDRARVPIPRPIGVHGHEPGGEQSAEIARDRSLQNRVYAAHRARGPLPRDFYVASPGFAEPPGVLGR